MLRRILVVSTSIILPILFIGLIYFLSKSISIDSPRVFRPQQMQLFVIGEQSPTTQINVLATTLPQFAVNLADGKFSNLWQADAAEKQHLVESSAVNAKGDTTLAVDTSFDTQKKQIIFTPKVQNKVKPGLYTLNIKVKTVQGEDITITQDFTWGVLAVNTNKGIYKQGDTVKIGMAVLDDLGMTKCIAKDGDIIFGTAKVWLTMTSPSGNTQNFSTDDGSITGSKSCADRSVTNDPDFLAITTAHEAGRYLLHMEAQTLLGRRSIDSFFMVNDTAPYDIERSVFPTRIYPFAAYPVTITVIPNTNFTGMVSDLVPSELTVTDVSDNGTLQQEGESNVVKWQASWEKGKIYVLSYTLHFPHIAPEFYFVGPLHVNDSSINSGQGFSEGREWQIASDSLFALQQQANNTITTNGTRAVTATLGHAAAVNDLLILICYRTQALSFSSPTPSTWNSFTNNHTTSGPRVYMYYRIATATTATAHTCNTTSANQNTTGNSLGAQLLEFSGNATSGVTDGNGATPHNNFSCNSSPFQSNTNTKTQNNSDDLIISAFTATVGSLTVSGHSNSYADTTATSGFSAANGTYDSGWLESVGSPPFTTVSDTISYLSGGVPSGGGTCGAISENFSSVATISQGSFRFFDNANAIDPGSPLVAANNNLQLGQRHYPFRLRILLDVDDSGGTIAVDAADFVLQYAVLPADGKCADGTYAQVGDTGSGTPIAFNTNAFSGGTSGGTAALAINSTVNDPSDSGNGYTTVLENYEEIPPNGTDNTADILNDNLSLTNNSAGEWDISLIDNSDDSTTTTYCLEITNADGSLLNQYHHYPEVTTIFNGLNILSGSKIRSGSQLK